MSRHQDTRATLVASLTLLLAILMQQHHNQAQANDLAPLKIFPESKLLKPHLKLSAFHPATVQENQRTFVECKVGDDLMISWFKDGKLLEPHVAKASGILIKSHEDIAKIKSLELSSELHINQATLKHAGNYTCVGQSLHARAQESAQLAVVKESLSLSAPEEAQPSIVDSQSTKGNSGRTLHTKNSRQRLHSKRQIQNDQDSASMDLSSLNHHDEPLALGLGSEQSPTARNSANGQRGAGKRTLYACEEKQLEIECQLGESIQLIRANYGRFSIQICNEHGQLDWKVNCMSPDSFDIIARSCQAKQSCQLLASNDIFGDACPGTQKYLEVHYQCVQATSLTNKTIQEQQQTKANNNQIRLPISKQQANNVILQQQQHDVTTSSSSTPGINSETSVQRAQWPQTKTSVVQANAPLPNWMIGLPVGLTSTTASRFEERPVHVPTTPSAPALACAPVVFRQLQWPATEAGQVAQVECRSSKLAWEQDSIPRPTVSLQCQSNGYWAPHAQAAQCRSSWLQDLARRLEAGESPLSALDELVQKTDARVLFSTTTELGTLNTARYELFGSDLVQISRMIGRLVDEMVELLNGIHDDKQRTTFAREIIQRLVEVINNLSGEHQLEAWQDLPSATGERQRVAGQLVASLESACVLLAGTGGKVVVQPEAETFTRIGENVYVAIQTFPLGNLTGTNNDSSSNIQATFPSQATVLGTKWMNSEQRFTLNLQAALSDAAFQEAASISQQQLKVVFVMLRQLGQLMEPRDNNHVPLFEQQQTINANGQQQRVIVNSDLVSFSIVADTRRLKVDLSAPIELVFRHQFLATPSPSLSSATTDSWQMSSLLNQVGGRRAGGNNCVYWDTSSSDWLSEGCKLIGTNRTHSTCACNHLTTFGLLAEFEATTLASLQQQASSQQASNGIHQDFSLSQQQNRNSPLMRLHLDASESSELTIPTSGRPIYLAKLLDGNLFASDQTTRTLLYLACILSALMLALLLVATAYSRAQTRRLLGSMPSEPPPSLLVAHNLSTAPPFGNAMIGHQTAAEQQPSIFTNGAQQQAQNLATGPTTLVQSLDTTPGSQPTSYSSDLSQQSQNLILNKQLELNQMSGLYSLMNNDYERRQTLCKKQHHQQQQQQSHMALVPFHLVVKLFALQMLLLLLIESQSFLQQNVQWARRLFMQNNLMIGPATLNTMAQPQTDQQLALNPIGAITWFLLLVFYYLVSTLLCWLLAQLLLLNGHLSQKLAVSQADKQSARLRSSSSYQPVQMMSGSTSIYQPQNRYGQCQMYTAQQTLAPVSHQQASSSPTLSTFSSSLAQDLPSSSGHQIHRQQAPPNFSVNGTNKSTNLESQYNARSYNLKPTSYTSEMNFASDYHNWSHTKKLASSGHLNWFLVHMGPIIMSLMLVWSSFERVTQINQFAYTSSYTSQLAYWPLVFDLSWTSASIVHLYCLPSICLALGVLALILLRRHIRRRLTAEHRLQVAYGSNVLGSTVDQLTAEAKATTAAAAAAANNSANNQQLDPSGQTQHLAGQFGSTAAIKLGLESKSARFACLTLLALLTLNSICWIAFFIHCHQALSSSLNGQRPSSNNLILTFAASNLLISLLICASQRRTIRRALQLAGWSRWLLRDASGSSSTSTGRHAVKSTPSPGSTNSAASASHDDPMGSFYNNAAQQQHYGTSKTNKLTNSPSQHSLFVISRSRPTGQQQPQVAYGQHYNQQRAVQQHQQLIIQQQQQQQQHLYQQLAMSQQHIYDSTSNLHSLSQANQASEQQRQLNASHLMHQQQQQQQQLQQPMVNYTLSRQHQQQQFGGSQFHLNNLSLQTATNQHPQHMTLRPQQQQQQHMFHQVNGGAGRNPHDLLSMCPISGTNGHAKTLSSSSAAAAATTTRQLSGEADGPLVALASSTSVSTRALAQQQQQQQHPTTFGPTTINTQHTASNFHHTELRPSNGEGNGGSANQMMMMNRHEQNMSSPLTIVNQTASVNINKTKQQNQYFAQEQMGSVMEPQQQQQQHEMPMHFRRANSTTRQQQKQQNRSFASAAMMIDASRSGGRLGLGAASASEDHDDVESLNDDSSNIYDVANCVSQ